MATPSELVILVRTAIEARLNGGAVIAYTIDGKNLQRDPIPDLLALERHYTALQAAEQSSGTGITYARFDNPL